MSLLKAEVSARAVSRCLPVIAAVVVLTVSSCAIGPDYRRPSTPTVTEFKEARDWRQAVPGALEPGPWWAAFGDSQLDGLERGIDLSNQSLRLAEAQFREAQAVTRQSEAGLWPTVAAAVEMTRSQQGGALPSSTVPGTSQSASSSGAQTTRTVQLTSTWELDLWGGIRRAVESGRAAADASEADLAAARLSLQAELATAYLQLRTTDATSELLKASIREFERSVDITRRQYDVGVVSRADVLLAQTQLKQTEAELVDLGVSRSQLEHAIAVLLGKPPADFSLPPSAADTLIPPIPLGIPADLLERRPDVAAAERRVAAANARIGVATAAYFPNLTLSAGAGFQNLTSSPWLSAPNFFWSVGPQLAETLFAGGRLRAQTAQARAVYDETVATYRQTVLQSFQDVEDAVAALRILEEESAAQDETVRLARESVVVAMKQYKAGTVSYLNVATTQATALANARVAESLRGRRLVATVALIRALGGGWNAPAAAPSEARER